MTDTRAQRAKNRLYRHVPVHGIKRLSEAMGERPAHVSHVLGGHTTSARVLERIETILCRMDAGQSLEEAAR